MSASSDRWRRLEARIRFTLNDLTGEIANRDWRLPPRPWSDFFERFSVPQSSTASWKNRIALNSHIYQGNYCILLAVSLVYYVVRHPWSVFLVGGVTAGWVYATSPKPIVVRGRRITRHERFLFASVASFLLLAIAGVISSFAKTFAVVGTCILVHSSARHTSMRNKIGEIRTHMADHW